MSRLILILALLLLSVLALVIVQGDPGAPVGDAAAPTEDRLSSQPVSAPRQGYESALLRGATLGAPPASLAGTTVDGELEVDADGRLVPTVGLRRVFDYFLVTLGEEDLESIKARIAWHLGEKLPPDAAAEAWAIFEQYLDYRDKLEALPPQERSAAGVRAALRDRQALRQSHFGPRVAEAFFGFEAATEEYTLARMAIQEDPALDESERERRLEQIEQQLPEPVRALMAEVKAPVRVSRRVAELREEGASDAEVRALREQHFGPEAAERLAELDREREAWQRRYDDYRAAREGILQSGLAPADREAEIERLQQRLFDEAERRRVQALDRISAGTTGEG